MEFSWMHQFKRLMGFVRRILSVHGVNAAMAVCSGAR